MAIVTVLTYYGVIPDAGVLGFCITATLTLFLSNTTPSSVSLFPIPLVLNCKTLNVLSSLRQMEQGLEMVRVMVLLIAGFLRPSRGRRFNLYFSDTVLHLRVRNISHAPIQNIWCTGSLLLDWSRLGYIQGMDTWQ